MEVDSDYHDGGGYVVYGSGDDDGGYMAAVMANVVYGSGDDDGGIWQR